MSLHIETVNNPRVFVTTVGQFAEDTDYEHREDETDDRLLVLDYDEVVVITGDLETFARNVWSAVFDQEVPAMAARDAAAAKGRSTDRLFTTTASPH